MKLKKILVAVTAAVALACLRGRIRFAYMVEAAHIKMILKFEVE
jgi:hypothetical protein